MIRRYQASDINAIVSLELQTLGTSLGEDMLKNELNNDLSYIYVYEDNNEILGYISFVFDGEISEVLNFCVAINHQGKGIGTKLLEYCLNYFKTINAKTSILEVRESNIKAIGLYNKIGYKRISTRKNYYSNGENALVLEKIL